MAAAAGQCVKEGQWSLVTAVAAVLAEGLFYAGVAALWLLIVQWDLLDRILGGPGTSHEERMRALCLRSRLIKVGSIAVHMAEV